MAQSEFRSETPKPRANQARSRVGKTGVTVYLEPDAKKQLRTLALDEDATLQSLMIEATNMLFKSRRKAAIAK